MSSFREKKRKARRVLHIEMQVPAVVIADGSETLVSVRVHSNIEPKGGVKGTSFAYAERLDTSPSLIFWRYQFEPKRGMIVSVESGEAYAVDTVEPADDITVTAVCVRLPKSESAGLPLPDAAGSLLLPLPTTWYPATTNASVCDREFLPTPTMLSETGTHFYMGWQFATGWLVRQKERNSSAYLDATQDNNPSQADLTAAFTDPAALNYA